jgi:rubrerythrin
MTMIDDPIVEDVYRAREKILEQCHGDLRQWIDRLKAAEAQHQDRLVNLETVRKKRQRSQSLKTPYESA